MTIPLLGCVVVRKTQSIHAVPNDHVLPMPPSVDTITHSLGRGVVAVAAAAAAASSLHPPLKQVLNFVVPVVNCLNHNMEQSPPHH